METLKLLANLLNSDDFKRLFRQLSKNNTRQDVHNTMVLEALKTYDINALERLRNKIGNNAFHALTKRLQDVIVNFIGATAMADGSSVQQMAARLLAAARIMLEHKAYKPAFKCLAKAEKLAITGEHYALLNDVYLPWIQYAHCQNKTNLEALLQKQAANRALLDTEERLTLAYALLRAELAEIYHKGKVTDLAAVVSETFAKFGLSERVGYTYRSLYQLLFILNEQASVRQDYSAVLPYLEESYAFIKSGNDLVYGHLYYRIQILYYLANACLRNRRFKECSRYLDEMNVQMKREDARYEKRFNARYTLLRALNENYSGAPGTAEAVIQKELERSKGLETSDVADLRLAAAVLCLQHQDRSATKHMRELMRTDSYYEKHMGRDWLIKKLLVEVVMHTEFGNPELALARIKGLVKKYGVYLKEVGEDRVLHFINLTEKYILYPEKAAEKPFRKAAEKLAAGEDDLFVLAFTGWVLAKALRQPVYEVTLKLVQGAYFSPSHSA